MLWLGFEGLYNSHKELTMTKSFEEMAAREKRKVENAKLAKEKLEQEKIRKEAREKEINFIAAVKTKLDNRFYVYYTENKIYLSFDTVTAKDLVWISEALGTENVSIANFDYGNAVIVVSDICLKGD